MVSPLLETLMTSALTSPVSSISFQPVMPFSLIHFLTRSPVRQAVPESDAQMPVSISVILCEPLPKVPIAGEPSSFCLT